MQVMVGFSFVRVPLPYIRLYSNLIALYSEGSNHIASVKLSVISCANHVLYTLMFHTTLPICHYNICTHGL